MQIKVSRSLCLNLTCIFKGMLKKAFLTERCNEKVFDGLEKEEAQRMFGYLPVFMVWAEHKIGGLVSPTVE